MKQSDFQKEILYQATASIFRSWYCAGVISMTEWKVLEGKLNEKYTPVIGNMFLT